MRTELLNKLATIGQNLFMSDETLAVKIALGYVAKYVSECTEQFDLDDDEMKALMYLIVRIK